MIVCAVNGEGHYIGHQWRPW